MAPVVHAATDGLVAAVTRERDTTAWCPRGARCEACGVERRDLHVRTVPLAGLGVACLTLCPPCSTSGVTPPVAVTTAGRLVAQHRQHLSLTTNQTLTDPLSPRAVLRALDSDPSKED